MNQQRLSIEDLPSAMWAGIIQLTEGPNKTKGQREGESISVLDLGQPPSVITGSYSMSSQTFGHRLNRTASWPGPPACR